MARNFQHWLKAYIDYTGASEAPISFHFWTGVWTIAAALRRRVWRDETYFQWTPNFYITLVAPPGIATKSTTMSIGKDLLSEVDGVHFGPDSGSWQGLGDALNASLEYFDWTDEYGTLKHVPMSAISIAASELGTFLNPDDEQAVSFLTDAWDGRSGKYIHRTKHSGSIEIENAWLNVLGATTPAWIRRNIPESMIGEGLMSRTIFVYADAKRELISLPSKRARASRTVRQQLIEDLQHIAKNLVGNFSFEDRVSRHGGWMDVWYTRHNGPRTQAMASDRYGGYHSRKQTHMVKLAMILSVAKRDTMVIMEEDLIEADKLLTDTESSMIKVFEAIGVVDEAKHMAEIVAFVRAYQWITVPDLYYKCCFNIMSEADFKQSLRLGLESGMLKVESRAGQRGVVPAPRTTN